jgi:hypothetical protein
MFRDTLMKIHISWGVTLCGVVNSYQCSEAWKEGCAFNFGFKLYPSRTS